MIAVICDENPICNISLDTKVFKTDDQPEQPKQEESDSEFLILQASGALFTLQFTQILKILDLYKMISPGLKK